MCVTHGVTKAVRQATLGLVRQWDTKMETAEPVSYEFPGHAVGAFAHRRPMDSNLSQLYRVLTRDKVLLIGSRVCMCVTHGVTKAVRQATYHTHCLTRPKVACLTALVTPWVTHMHTRLPISNTYFGSGKAVGMMLFDVDRRESSGSG
jgi:hypothetical protein